MSLSYEVTFRGFPACPCLATWLPAYEAELQRRGILTGPLHIYQLIGGAPASGGTHTQGGAFDTAFLSNAAVRVARDMGADATWHRRYNWDGKDGMEHVHGVLTHCPHNGPAAYQIAAVRDGFNGLGYLGHAAPDDGPRPLSGRTWEQGIAWARRQEDDMPYQDWPQADKDALTKDIADAIWGRVIKVADNRHASNAIGTIYVALKSKGWIK